MNLSFWKRSPDAWTGRLYRKSRTYRRPPQSYSMTTDNELELLETYARDRFTGAGRIVDLGCWYGATTMSLARGLAENTRAKSFRSVDAIDLFEWHEWMNPNADRVNLPKRYRTGDNFYEDVRDLLRPYGSLVRVEKQNLLTYVPPPDPIEFLFVDAMKNWELAQAIVSNFFPLLLPETSYVVQQDFAYYFPEIATNHLIMWRLRDCFRCVHHVRRSCSVVFRCVKSVDPARLPVFTPDLFTPEMIDEAYDYSFACVSRDARIMLEVAKLNFLIERGESSRDAVRRQMRRIARSSRGLSSAMLGEVRTVASKTAAALQLPADWLGEIDDWVSSMLQAAAKP